MADIIHDVTFTYPVSSNWTYSGSFMGNTFKDPYNALYLGAGLGSAIDTVSQTLTTVIGQYYEITFQLYMNYNLSRRERSFTTCSCGTNNILITDQDADSHIWKTYSYIFKAINSSSVLLFTSWSTAGSAYNALYGVTCIPCSAPAQLTPSAPTNLSASSNIITFTGGSSNGYSITDYSYSINGGENWIDLEINPTTINLYNKTTWYAIDDPNLRSPLVIPLSTGTYNTVMIRAMNLHGFGSSATLSYPMNVSIINNGIFEYKYLGWVTTHANYHYDIYPGYIYGNSILFKDNGSILSQKLITVIGETYTVNFRLHIKYNNTSSVTCTCVNTLTITQANAPSQVWKLYSITFTAISTSTLLLFTYTAGDGPDQALVSDITCANGDLPYPVSITSIASGNACAAVTFIPTSTSNTYQYKMSTNSGVSWESTWTTVTNNTELTSPLTIPGLTAGLLYQIRILTTNSAGTVVSNAVNVQVSVPTVPTVTSVNSGSNSAIITYTIPNLNGSTITGLSYMYSTNSGSTWTSPISINTTTSPLTIQLTVFKRETYIFQIAVLAIINGITVKSPYSTISQSQWATPYTLVTPALSIIADSIIVIDHSIGVDIVNYQWSYDNTTWTSMSPAKSSYPLIISLSELTIGTSYSVGIRAILSGLIGVTNGPIAYASITRPSIVHTAQDTVIQGSGQIIPGTVGSEVLTIIVNDGTNSTITDGSLANLPSLISLDLSGSPNLTNIPPYLCSGDVGLNSIILPSSITTIGTGAFLDSGLLDFSI